ncbi:ABC multidrug transporter [Colletotrichum truncatum]|uniref:ABC multidrug transporter n=1 Tax=Colletotrichum truncatum TaxID=5467 RepID=A0ACC3Z346_COLTU|nr:ABC multidrug transporter [Colletotrichum truncatum]KAF6793174.1 ABC multidrug transporter [Colletotrichum truncatum]
MDNFTAIAECDSSFGPTATFCSDRFDFTLLFEQSLLNIGPSAVLLLALPLRLQQLFRQRRKVLQHPLNAAKIAACVAFGGLQMALLVLWARAPLANRVSIAAAVLGVVDALALGVLSHTEHVRSVRPSTIICLYLMFSLVFDAVHCRTLWLLPDLGDLAAVSTAALAMKLTMFLLEAQGKRRFLLATLQRLSPEATSGIISRGFFWWLNDLMTRGFKATLSLTSLYDIDEGLQSEILLQRILHGWEQRKDKDKHALLFALFHSTKSAVIFTAFPRLMLIGFKFAQPFLINRVINYVDGDRGSDPKSVAYGLIAATGMVYLGSALLNGFYQHKLFRFITITRGSLASLVLSKNLDNDFSRADDSSAALTLVSSDVKNICKSFEAVHEVWANPIEIGIAIWLLQRQLGLGSIGPAITVIMSTIGTGKLAQLMPPAMKVWIENIQKRITVTSEVLGSIKEVKMLGMVGFLQEAIQNFRVIELSKAKQYRAMITYMNILGNIPSMIGPVVTFGIALLAKRVNAGASLSIATVFTSLSIIGLMAGPLSQLIASVPSLFASLGSFERIQTFISQPSHSTGPSSVSEASESNSEPCSSVNDHSLGTVTTPSSKAEVAMIQNGSFSIRSGDEPLLHSVNIRILPSTMTMIIGRVGSGKTVLLRGLLGELAITGHVKTLECNVAYCAQTTWLETSTVKQNILAQSPLDQEWYEKVVYACALVPDFSTMPEGDETVVGGKGQSLSGGQKQRVALARAIYARKPVLVVDDALSGLDPSTQKHIWDHVFRSTGLIRELKTTVILATHSLNYLHDADQIVILGDDKQVANQGTFDDLRHSAYLASLSLDGSHGSRAHDKVAAITQEMQGPNKSKKVVEENDREADLLRKAGDTSLYWYYLKSIGWLYGSAGAIFLIGDCLVRIFPQIWLKYWTEDDARTGGADTGMYFGIYAGMSMFGLVIIGINIWVMFVMIVPKSSQNLHWKLLRTVMRAPLSFFITKDTGDLINRFSQDLSHIDRDLPVALFMTSIDCLSAAVLIMIGAKYLAAVIPVALISLYCLQAFYLRTSRQMRFLDLQAQAPLFNKLVETIDGLSTIRAFGWRSEFRESSLHLLDQSQKPYYLLFCIQRWLTLVLDIFVGAIAILLVSLAMMIPDSTSTGAIAIAFYNVLSFNETLATLITSWTELETSLGAISRLREFESKTPYEASPAEGEQKNIPPLWPSHGRLEIKNITASYSTDTKPALQDVSLSLNPGAKVAICGRSGSGKSSLTLTLFKLLSLDAGSIIIDGVDISRVPNEFLRRRLIAIPQEPLLFPGTLRTNLFPYTDDLSPDEIPSDESLISALTKVSLWQTISANGGLDVDVSSLALSKGQKQLFCLARAIVRKHSSKILILDEATSAVDQETEETMSRIIETEFSSHTVISVVHRPQALRGMDMVVTLQGGKILKIAAPEL